MKKVAKTSAKKAMKAPAKKTVKKDATDIIELILKDHIPLKKNIKILKDSDVSMAKKKMSFAEFAPLLLQHADPEEKALYVYMKDENKEMRVDGFEGQQEHAIAAQLVDEIKATQDPDQWMARLKVLAELVEHHIEEEEGDMLKKIKKEVDAETRAEIGQEYLQLRADFAETHSNAKASERAEMRAH